MDDALQAHGGTFERARVQAHIARAEGMAHTRDTSALSAVQKLVRSLLLQLLAEYRTAGIFPSNSDFVEATPYFIDARGVPCAMAYLLELGGEHAMVAKIASERNNATIAQLADEARLIDWLHASGLTVGEAAAIQPMYCEAVSDCYCYGGLYGRWGYPRTPIEPLFHVETVARGQLVASSPEGWSVLVQDVYGNCARTTVGDTLQMVNFDLLPPHPSLVPGQVVLVGMMASRDGAPLSRLNGVVVNADETISCARSAVPATAAELTAAVLSADCAGTLISLSPQWNARFGFSCDAGRSPDVPTGDAASDAVEVTTMDVVSEDHAPSFDAASAADVDATAPRDVTNANRCINPSRPDAGAALDGPAIDASSQDAGTPQTIGGGCGCRTNASDNTPVSSFAILAALFGALTLRARRHRAVASSSVASAPREGSD